MWRSLTRVRHCEGTIDMPRVVPAVNRALNVLELFLDCPELSARQVMERLDNPAPPSTSCSSP